MSRKKIAVIGSGASGLTSIKACLEEGFQVICYEMQDNIGGLWRYRDEDIDGLSSVMGSTVIDTSKEMSAFSDFPPPTEFPNHMHNTIMIKYIELYADNFQLQAHIQFRHKVLKVKKINDYNETGRFLVRVQELDTKIETEDVFDGVMVCTGHHVFPNVPEFKGMNLFEGNIIHSHSYKRPVGFLNKKVVVVGIGNSGADVCVELSGISQKVYLSTRRGAWILPLLGPNGYPNDAHFFRRSFNFLIQLLPVDLVSRYMESHISNKFSHGMYNLKPRHRLLSQHPTLNDVLPTKILNGTITVKSDIDHFTPKGVVFKNEEDKEYECDTVVLATGYFIKFPFMEKDIFYTEDNQCNLYKHVFPSNLKHPSLAFIGLAQPVGSVFPISENQARWYARLMAGKVEFPSQTEMRKDVEVRSKMHASRFYASYRHTVEVDWIPYMDEIASQYGAKPNLWKLALKDPRLALQCFRGPCLPYQYRIEGPGACKESRNAILTYNKRVRGAFNTRARPPRGKRSFCSFRNIILFIKMAILAVIVYLMNFFH